MISIETILNSSENDYMDFKREWYKPDEFKCDMVHDILCMANSLTDSPDRYIIIGLYETKRVKKKKFHDIRKDVNAKTAEQIIDKLRDCIAIPPKIEVIPVTYNKHHIEIIQITPSARNLPYVLSKDCHNKIKNKTIHKNIVYTRNSSQNTPVCEQCDLSIIEELFARKHGEDLPIQERFTLLIEDTDNWQKSGNCYYYSKNSNFRIVCVNSDENIRYFDKIESYHEILVDTCISKEYWDFYKWNYDDFYSWFDVELYANNTLIKTTSIMEFFSKHFFPYKNLKHLTYFLPPRDNLKINYKQMEVKKDIIDTFEWKICKILFKCNLPADIKYHSKDAEEILDNLNYEFLQNSSKYINDNKNWIYGVPDEEIRNAK